MNNINNTACFTGHRPKDLPWGYAHESNQAQSFKSALEKQILESYNSGYTHFITGMAEGVDTYAAEILISLRDNNNLNITIEAAVPCSGQEKKWSKESKNHYHEILSKLDYVTTLSEHYTPYCMHKRNDYMLSKSSLVIAGFSGTRGGTSSTLKKAQKQNKHIVIVDPQTHKIQTQNSLLN